MMITEGNQVSLPLAVSWKQWIFSLNLSKYPPCNMDLELVLQSQCYYMMKGEMNGNLHAYSGIYLQ